MTTGYIGFANHFGPFRQLPAISPGQREINSHRATPRRRKIATATGPAPSPAGPTRAAEPSGTPTGAAYWSAPPEAQTTGISTARRNIDRGFGVRPRRAQNL